MNWLLDLLFGCRHVRYSWPLTTKEGTHVCCLECGRKLPYDFAGLGRVLTAPMITAPRRWVWDGSNIPTRR